MPVLRNAGDATWNAKDYVEFKTGVDRMQKLMCNPSKHFSSNEIMIFKAMAKKLNEIASEFEEEVEHTPLTGHEVVGLSGLRASMGGNNEVNRSRLWNDYLNWNDDLNDELNDGNRFNNSS